MKWSTLRNCALIATAVLPLSGCLVLSALMGASGFVLTGPAQYIGTVYTVGEYTYEMAVNDKTPDMVIKEKLAWLTGSDETDAPQPTLLAEREPPAPVKTLQTAPLPSPSLNTAPALPTVVELAMLESTDLPRRISQPANSVTRQPPKKKTIVYTHSSPKAKTLEPIVTPDPRPTMSTAAAPPPQPLIRIQRMEQAFRAADMRLPLRPQYGNSIRIEMPPDLRPDGINGTWRIRHQVS